MNEFQTLKGNSVVKRHFIQIWNSLHLILVQNMKTLVYVYQICYNLFNARTLCVYTNGSHSSYNLGETVIKKLVMTHTPLLKYVEAAATEVVGWTWFPVGLVQLQQFIAKGLYINFWINLATDLVQQSRKVTVYLRSLICRLVGAVGHRQGGRSV